MEIPEQLQETYDMACTVLDAALTSIIEDIIKDVIEVKRLTIQMVHERQMSHKKILTRLLAMRTELSNLHLQLSETHCNV